jgi:hypothetical protein
LANQQMEEEEDEEEEEDLEEQEQIRAIEKMLDEPELKKVPRYFFKISNAYFMSTYRYYHQGFTTKRPSKEASKAKNLDDLEYSAKKPSKLQLDIEDIQIHPGRT